MYVASSGFCGWNWLRVSFVVGRGRFSHPYPILILLYSMLTMHIQVVLECRMTMNRDRNEFDFDDCVVVA